MDLSVIVIMLIGFSPILIGLGYLIFSVVKYCCHNIAKYPCVNKTLSQKEKVKQKFLFYNLWLPCSVFTPLCVLMAALLGRSMFVLYLLIFSSLFCVFYLFYYLVYFIFAKIVFCKKFYVNKKYGFIALVWVVVEAIAFCYLMNVVWS